MWDRIFKFIIELLILGAAVGFIVYLPELLPRCSVCKKIKPRWRFGLHTDVSLSLSRKGNKSVCKRCCSKEEIQSIADLRTKKEIKDRVKYKTKYTL